MTKKSYGGRSSRLGLVGGKREDKGPEYITIKLDHTARFLLAQLRQEATQRANALSFALWERIGKKCEWTEEELDILSAANEEAQLAASKLTQKCEKCGHLIFGVDPASLSLEAFLFKMNAKGEYIASIPAKEYKLSGYQHKLVVDILQEKSEKNELSPGLWPLYKLFVGVGHLDDDEPEPEKEE